jgi:hypothetical protein
MKCDIQGNAKQVFCVVCLAEIFSAVAVSAECNSAGRTDWKVCVSGQLGDHVPPFWSMQPAGLPLQWIGI